MDTFFRNRISGFWRCLRSRWLRVGGAQAQPAYSFSAGTHQMLAPIALYLDALLSQI
jgi:hypothetical protein